MADIATSPAPSRVPHLQDDEDLPTTTGPIDSDRRLATAGLAGLTWFALLIVTNIMNGSVAPAADADVDEVVAHLVVPATMACSAINPHTASMASPAPMASLRHPRPTPHRPAIPVAPRQPPTPVPAPTTPRPTPPPGIHVDYMSYSLN